VRSLLTTHVIPGLCVNITLAKTGLNRVTLTSILSSVGATTHVIFASSPPLRFYCPSLIIFRGTAHAIFASNYWEYLIPSLRPVANITLGGNSSCHLCVQFPPSRSGQSPSTFLAFKFMFHVSFSVAYFIKVMLSNKITRCLSNGLWFFHF